jgi:hypothetical protein
MDRRDFLTTGALFTTSLYMNACGSSSDALEATQEKPKGAITLYYEFNIAKPSIVEMLVEVNSYLSTLDSKKGFLSLSLKNMIGESTMVKNFSNDLKGVLKSAYIDSAQMGKRPYRYSLFIRFDNYDNMIASNAKSWFTNSIKSLLAVYNKEGKTSMLFDFYQGIYKTVAGGDVNGIYNTEDEILNFLSHQQDVANLQYQTVSSNGSDNGVTITVENHVSINDINTKTVNEKALNLLTIAQQTYQPKENTLNGESGTLNDNNYKKALTTEILQNAYSIGDKRDYLFHGVWHSIADHENSHIDRRFMKASQPLGIYIVDGPVEPFYQTIIVHNKN